MAQGNDAAAGSRRGRSFERLEELCQKAAGTPPATFWGVFYGFVGLPESNPREKTELAFWFERHLRLLVGDNVSRPLRTRRFHRQAFFMQIAPPAVGIAS